MYGDNIEFHGGLELLSEVDGTLDHGQSHIRS